MPSVETVCRPHILKHFFPSFKLCNLCIGEELGFFLVNFSKCPNGVNSRCVLVAVALAVIVANAGPNALMPVPAVLIGKLHKGEQYSELTCENVLCLGKLAICVLCLL